MGITVPNVKVWDGTNVQAVKPANTAPDATDPAGVVALSPNSLAADNSPNGNKLPVLAALASSAATTYTTGRQVPLSVDLGGALRILLSSWLGSAAPTVGQKAMASCIPVVLASDQPSLQVAPALASTSVTTGVSGSATTKTLLAANANRRGATIHNDSGSPALYLKIGAAASIASGGFTTVLQPGGYYELPFQYTGVIDGIWASAGGFANVTELTA